MMSVERSFEAWEEVQRHGQDLADRLAQGFTGLIQSHITPPSFQWPNAQAPKLFDMDFPPSHNFAQRDFGLAVNGSAINGVSAIFDVGNRIGQAGWDFGAFVNGMVEQVFRRLPLPFRHDNESLGVSMLTRANAQSNDLGISLQEDLGSLAERFREYGFVDNKVIQEDSTDEGKGGVDAKSRLFGGSEGTINFTSTFESRTQTLETTMAARGDLWRVEAKASNAPGSENASLFLVQLGPVLFVRDSTLLLPIHLSKQHLLWYGYDRKHGMHSLCPAMWSKHRRWLLMSMLCLNPLACSFMDLQFPNGQITYVAGEGISTSAFLPLCGGLLQAQGQYPGEMRFSFSCKNKFGTCITPMVQLPDKSFSLGLAQSLAWKRSGLMVRPTVQFSLCPTFGGIDPGVQAELTHSLNEELSLTCGCSMVARPTAFASISLGRSKWNGNVGTSGVVVKVETPLDARRGRPNLSVQMNSGFEF